MPQISGAATAAFCQDPQPPHLRARRGSLRDPCEPLALTPSPLRSPQHPPPSPRARPNGRNGPNGRPAPQQAALPGPCRSPRSPPRSLGALAAWGSGSPRGRRAAPRCHRCRARSRASAPLAASEVGRGFVPPAVAAAAMARGERVPPVPAVPGWQRRAGRCGEEPAGSVPESSWLQTALEALSWGWVKKKNAFGGNKGTAPDTSQGWRGVVTGLRSELRAGRKKV